MDLILDSIPFTCMDRKLVLSTGTIRKFVMRASGTVHAATIVHIRFTTRSGIPGSPGVNLTNMWDHEIVPVQFYTCTIIRVNIYAFVKFTYILSNLPYKS